MALSKVVRALVLYAMADEDKKMLRALYEVLIDRRTTGDVARRYELSKYTIRSAVYRLSVSAGSRRTVAAVLKLMFDDLLSVEWKFERVEKPDGVVYVCKICGEELNPAPNLNVRNLFIYHLLRHRNAINTATKELTEKLLQKIRVRKTEQFTSK